MVTVEMFNTLIRLGLLDRKLVGPNVLVTMREYIEAVEKMYETRSRLENNNHVGTMVMSYIGPFFTTQLRTRNENKSN